MTPAIELLQQSGVHYTLHEYRHEPGVNAYGAEAVAALNVPAQEVFKTLVVELDNREFAVAIVPVAHTLSTKALAKALGTKKVKMADKAAVSRVTGYVLGGVSPLAQKKTLRTVIDSSAETFETVHVSAGRRGLEIELAPTDLAEFCNASFADIGQASVRAST